MSVRPLRRVLSTAAALAVGVASLAVPATADSTTISHVGPGGGAGACAAPDFATIQAAIDAADPGDIILVCPGTYPERLQVATPDLTIKGVRPWTATVKPPASAPSPLILFSDSADQATLQWLKVVARTTGGGCVPHDAIKVDGATDVTIRSNRVRASTGGNTRNGPCTLQTGIHLAPGSSGVVRNNAVRDFSVQGIWAQTAGEVDIIDNSVRYWHPATCVTAACGASGPAIAPVVTGINVYNTPALVQGNAVSSTPDTLDHDWVPYGIRANSSSAVIIRGNLVLRANVGIILDPADDARVSRNTVDRSRWGIIVGSNTDDARIRANTITSASLYGISMQAGAGNDFIDNDASGAASTIYDCIDDTAASNTWTGNLGATSSPSGLCEAP